MLCYYRSRPSQFTVFLPTFPSLLFHGPSNPETNPLPRVLSKLISQGDPGNEFAPSFSRFCDTYISSLRLNARFTCWRRSWNRLRHHHHRCPSPWHHLYFIVVVDNLYNRLSCQPFFQSYQWQCLTRQFLHLSKKGDKAVRNLVKVLTEKKGSYPPFFFSYFAVLTHAYLGHLIWYKTLIKNFPPILASIRAQCHSRQVLPHHLVKDGHWIFFLY